MAENPLISVCVPLFNKAATVESTLRSVLAYESHPMEILVFDNGSTDGSTDIVAQLAASEPRIRHIRIQHTIMIQESWRLAFLHGRGTFLKLQSADDELDPEFFPAMLPPLTGAPEIGFSVCAEDAVGLNAPSMNPFYATINTACKSITGTPDKKERARLLLRAAAENYLGNIYKLLVRRTCLPLERWKMTTRAYPLPTAYPDWDFLLRLMLNHRGHFVDRVLSHYRILAESPIARLAADPTLQVADAHQRFLMLLTVLADPELAPLRAAATREELQSLYQTAGKRMEIVVNMALSIPPRG